MNETARGTALPAWTPYLALFTDSPVAGGVEFTDITAPGYVRQPVTFGASSGGTMLNSAAVTFGPAGEDWPSALYAGFYDAASGGTLRRYGALQGTASDRALIVGASMQFAIGSIVWRESV